MLNFNNWFNNTPKNVDDLTDIELVIAVANHMAEPEYKVYNIACKEVGIVDQEHIDKSFVLFYFAMLKGRRCVLLPKIREEFEKAYNILTNQSPK